MTTNTTTSKKSSDKPTRLYAHVVLDRSGSMASCADDAVGGYNSYVAQLPGTSLVSLTLFDSEGVDLIRDGVTPAAARLNADEYQPRGWTPLYDAIGHTIVEAEKRSAGLDRIALVILTDGEENSSREFNREDIRKLLTAKQEQDGWLVIYLGANQDAWAVGEKFGSVAINTMSIDPDNIGLALDSAARATGLYVESSDRQSGRRDAAFSKDDRKRALSK